MAVLGGWGKDIYDWAGDELGGWFHAPWKRALAGMAGPIAQPYIYNKWTTGHVGNANDQIYGQLGMVPFAAAAYFGAAGGIGAGAAGGGGSAGASIGAGAGAGAGEVGAGAGGAGGGLFSGIFGGGGGAAGDALAPGYGSTLFGTGGDALDTAAGQAIFGGGGAGGGGSLGLSAADYGFSDGTVTGSMPDYSGGGSSMSNYHAPNLNSDGSVKGFERPPEAAPTLGISRLAGRSQPYQLPSYASPALTQQQQAITGYSRPMELPPQALFGAPGGRLGNPATPYTTASLQGY